MAPIGSTIARLMIARYQAWRAVTVRLGLDPAMHGAGDRFLLNRGRGLGHGWDHATMRAHVTGAGV